MNIPRRLRVHMFGLQTLYISLALLLLGSGLHLTLLAMRGRHEGFSEILIGLIGSAYFFGYLIGCRVVQGLVERVAHIRTFAALAALCTCVSMGFTIWVNPYFWIVLRMLMGICMAGLYVVVESWVNQIAVNSNRGRVISQYRIVDVGATLFAQCLLFFFDVSGPQLFALFAVFMAASIIPITMTRTVIPEVHASSKVRLREAFKRAPYPVIGCFLLGLLNSSMWALSPLFLQDTFNTKNSVPIFGICYLLGGLVLQPSIGRWSDRKDRRIVISLLSLLTAAATFFIPMLAQGNQLVFWGLILLYGCVAVPIYSLCLALAHDQSKAGEYVHVTSALLFSYGLGAVQGPTYSGILIKYFGSASLFYFMSGGFFLFSLYGIYRITQRQAVRADHLPQYAGVPVEAKPRFVSNESQERNTGSF